MKSLSRVRLLVTPWTVAHQAPPSMGFSRQECWSGCHCLLLLKSDLSYFPGGMHPLVQNEITGTSPVVQWLGLCASTAGGPGLIPGWGTKILKLLVLLRTYLSGYPKAILRGQDRAAGQQKQEGGLWGCSAALQEGFILLAHCTLARLICSPR